MRYTLATSLLASSLLLAPDLWAAPVNINQATAEQIDAALVGIGPVKAKAIVEYRTAHGPFKSVDELKHVHGIGQKTVDKLAADIKLGDTSAPPPAAPKPEAAKTGLMDAMKR